MLRDARTCYTFISQNGGFCHTLVLNFRRSNALEKMKKDRKALRNENSVSPADKILMKVFLLDLTKAYIIMNNTIFI